MICQTEFQVFLISPNLHHKNTAIVFRKYVPKRWGKLLINNNVSTEELLTQFCKNFFPLWRVVKAAEYASDSCKDPEGIEDIIVS